MPIESHQIESRIKVVIVGHTNVGKTTFIRSLTRTGFGNVDDRANVTEYAEPIYDHLLNVIFIDTPGFQKAGALQALRSAFKLIKNTTLDWLNFRNSVSDDSLRFDERATEAIVGSDLVLYVATLTDVPDASHSAELALTRQHQPRVIGVINQFAKIHSQDPDTAAKRIAQWTAKFEESEIGEVVLFDSHWEGPGRLIDLYEAIRRQLPPDKILTFSEGLQNVRRQLEGRIKAIESLVADCISRCKSLEVSGDSSKYQYNETDARRDLRSKLIGNVQTELESFARDTKALFCMEANQPLLADDALAMLHRASKNHQDMLVNAASYGAIGGSALGLFGAVVGTFILPGLGTVIGAAIGGGAGGTGGAVVGADLPTNTHLILSLGDADLQKIFEACLAVAWGLSFQGFGLSDRVSEKTIRQLRSRVAAEAAKIATVSRRSSREEIMTSTHAALMNLESTGPIRL